MQFRYGWDCRLKELERELGSVVIGPVVRTDHLKELLTSLEGANLGGQVQVRSINVAEK